MHDKQFELEMLKHAEEMSKKHPDHETHHVYVDGLLVAYVTTPVEKKKRSDARE